MLLALLMYSCPSDYHSAHSSKETGNANLAGKSALYSLATYLQLHWSNVHCFLS